MAALAVGDTEWLRERHAPRRREHQRDHQVFVDQLVEQWSQTMLWTGVVEPHDGACVHVWEEVSELSRPELDHGVELGEVDGLVRFVVE